MRTPVRRADEHLRWLRDHMRSDFNAGVRTPGLPSLAALTGCDMRALEAIDRLWDLHSYCDRPARVIEAIALAALEMQASTRPLARELIARAKDWSDRDRLWPLVEEAMARQMSVGRIEGRRAVRLVEDAINGGFASPEDFT